MRDGRSHEGGKCLFASQGDPPETFEFIEEALCLMALCAEPPVDRRGRGPAGTGLDLRRRAGIVYDEGPERIGVIRGIGDDVTDTLQAAQQSPGPVGNRRIIRVLDGDGSANQSRRRQREVWSSAPA